jgi:DNA-binding MurR/RpiR family transcriptional regulator
MSATTIEAKIHATMHDLTPAERRVARVLLASYPTIGLAPLSELAAAAGASAATALRFVSSIGFSAYPEFQRRLRQELDERIKSPLEKPHASEPARRGRFLGAYFGRVESNLRQSLSRIPASEFEAVCQHLAAPKAACHVIGGRFTDAIAAYLVAHLQIVRPRVRRLEPRTASRIDQLTDIRAGDAVIVFDVRRYDPELARTAKVLAARRAHLVLITDFWISPVSQHAKFVLPCAIASGRTWDSAAALFALSEAIIARVTDLLWETAEPRMRDIERLQHDAF